MKLYFIAGEKSGDARGAELMEALSARETGIEFCGAGGPKMKALAGECFEDWVEEAGVIGIVDVLRKYPYFKRKFDDRIAEIIRLRPDAVVLIDYPGFNLRMAEALKKQRVPVKILYYISPQVWAWNRQRIPKMGRTIDLMICIFPFEKELYNRSGLRTVFVGHPLVESLRREATAQHREENLVGLFPGSRHKEVSKIFPALLATAREIHGRKPAVRFEASAASYAMAELMRQMVAETPESPRIEIVERQSHRLMETATAGIVASGTATLEAAILRLPYVLIYKASWITFALGRRLVKVPYIGMVNILAGRELVREFLQEEAEPEAIAGEMLRLLDDREARAKLVREVDEVVAGLGGPGAAARAAEAILAELTPPQLKRPFV